MNGSIDDKITLIVKTTSECNAACSYCNYLGASRTTRLLQFDTTLLEELIRSALSLGVSDVEFIWHGGEPLLLGLDFYQQAIRFQQLYCHPDQKVRNDIQTNATLLTPVWVDFLKTNNFGVGISLDGPEEIHDLQRVYPSQKGTFSDVMRGVNHLVDAEVHFGVLAVVTRNSLAAVDKIYRFFTDNGMVRFDFLPHAEVVWQTGAWHPLSITAMEFTDFLLKILNLWFEEDNPNVHVRKLESLLVGLLGGRPALCKFAGTCARYLTVEPNGDLFPCDNFIGYSELCLGNLNDQPLDSILETRHYQEFQSGVAEIPSSCQKCKWYLICHAGCSYRRYMQDNGFSNSTYFCSTWETLLEEMSSRVSKVLGHVPFLATR